MICFAQGVDVGVAGEAADQGDELAFGFAQRGGTGRPIRRGLGVRPWSGG